MLGFLTVGVISFLQAFEKNSPFAAYKITLLESITQHGLHLRLLFYQLVKLDGMRLKIEGVLILCIVVDLAKHVWRNSTLKYTAWLMIYFR